MTIDTLNKIKAEAYTELIKSAKLITSAHALGAPTESPVPAVVMQISDRYPAVDPNLIQLLVEDIWAYGHTTPDDSDGKVVAVDFDGTIVEDAQFPNIGAEIPGAVDNLKKLIAEGWKIIIFSCRASLPGGRQQIISWCAQADLPVRAVLPKVHARWYIDNRALAFNNDWDKTYEKLHYDIHTELPASGITPGAIMAGDVTLNDIAGHLDINAEELKCDINQAYGDHTPEEVMILQSMYREKYGLNISLSRLAAAPDTTKYWLNQFAGLVDKISCNRIAAGDTVLVVKDGPRFASKGVVLKASAEGATVAIDGTLDDTLTVTDPTKDLKLMYGAAAASSNNPLLVSANAHYPRGVSASLLNHWHGLALKHIAKSCQGLRTVRTYAVSPKLSLANTTTGLDVETTQLRNLVSVDIEIEPASKVAAIRLTPTAGYTDASVKLVVADLVDSLVGYPHLVDMHLRYGGDDSYYMILGFDNEYQTKSIQSNLKSLLNEYIADSGMPGLSTEPTAETHSLIIDTSVTRYPAAYSVHKTSGCVCVPLDLTRLASFSKDQTTLSYLCKGVGSTDGSTVSAEGV
jgi:hypothetical protein